MPRSRNRATKPTGTLVLFALVGLGALATVLSVREEQQAVRLVDERATDLAASRIRGALSSTVASFRGADSLAVDGVVDRAEFDAFASGVTSNSLFQAVAYAEVVTAADRVEFTRRTGLTIRDTDGSGGFVPAVVRSRALVVAMVAPLTDANRPVLGFDLASDPVRLAAALQSEQSGAPAMSDRISTATEARPGVAVSSAIRRPDGSTVGFLSSGLDIGVVVQRSGVDTSGYEAFSIEMDGQPLIGNAGGPGAHQSFDIAGHRFTVRVHTGTGFNALLPILIGLGTLALLVAVMAASRRDARQRERIAVAARRSRSINELGQALAAATDVRTVVEAVLARGCGIMDADHAAIALRSAEEPARLSVSFDPTFPRDVRRRLADCDIDAQRPFSECVRTGEDVVVTDTAALAERFPSTVADAEATGIAAVVWTPLVFGRDLCIGAIGFTWSAAMSGAELEERLVAAHTVADLTSRSLERAITSMTVQAAADNLGELARGLAGSHNPHDVQLAVQFHAASILGARTAELVLDPGSEVATAPETVERIIKNRAGQPIGRLMLDWPRPLVLGAAQSAVFDTMVEMIGQTLERTELTEQEHQVIVQLQRDLLPPPPNLPGIDVAVRYQPAMSVVGLGGDFYDVIPADDDRVFVIIGDVTGHGSEAVAAMAELKAVIQSLLRGGSSLDAVCDEADLLLDRRHMYATAQIAELDPRRKTARMINAGHPYPVLRRADGEVQLLTEGHRPLLGLAAVTTSGQWSQTVPFGAGDTLLLYTDGLIERRTQSIDVGMQLLVDQVSAHGGRGSAADLVDRVFSAAVLAGNGDKTDDDMAVLVVRQVI